MQGVGGRGRRVAALLLATVLLSGCAETELFSHVVKSVDDGSQSASNGMPGGRIVYKVGKPYEVDGVWYYPHVNYHYDRTGIASWYGPNFLGRRTADGEIFNENAITAAHKTLPLPSIVRVTNLENGRSLIVRVNDRGPFVNGRIIDLSRRAAQLLGFAVAGTARVRVQIMAAQSRALAAEYGAHHGRYASTQVALASPLPTTVVAPPLSRPPADPEVTTAATRIPRPRFRPRPIRVAERLAPPKLPLDHHDYSLKPVAVPHTRICIQAGAFADYGNATRLKNRLAVIGNTYIKRVRVRGRILYLVRVGPADSVRDANRLLRRVIASGQRGALKIAD